MIKAGKRNATHSLDVFGLIRRQGLRGVEMGEACCRSRLGGRAPGKLVHRREFGSVGVGGRRALEGGHWIESRGMRRASRSARSEGGWHLSSDHRWLGFIHLSFTPLRIAAQAGKQWASGRGTTQRAPSDRDPVPAPLALNLGDSAERRLAPSPHSLAPRASVRTPAENFCSIFEPQSVSPVFRIGLTISDSGADAISSDGVKK